MKNNWAILTIVIAIVAFAVIVTIIRIKQHITERESDAIKIINVLIPVTTLILCVDLMAGIPFSIIHYQESKRLEKISGKEIIKVKDNGENKLIVYHLNDDGDITADNIGSYRRVYTKKYNNNIRYANTGWGFRIYIPIKYMNSNK